MNGFRTARTRVGERALTWHSGRSFQKVEVKASHKLEVQQSYIFKLIGPSVLKPRANLGVLIVLIVQETITKSFVHNVLFVIRL